MKDFSLFDNTFSLSRISAYSLSLQIDYNHFAYAIIDNIRKRFVALVNHNFDPPANKEIFLDMVDEVIKKDSYLQKQYKEVNFIYPSDKFMLMPEKYFERKKLKFYFEIDNILELGEEIQFNYIPDIKAYLLFGISSDITNFFVNAFPIINFYQQGIPIIKNYLNISKDSDDPVIAVNIIKKHLLDILVVRQGKVLFYNIFKCRGETQAVYDIVKVVKEFGLSSQVDLLGSVDKDDFIYKELVKLGLKVGFAKVQKGFTFDFDGKIQAHRFAPLLYLSE